MKHVIPWNPRSRTLVSIWTVLTTVMVVLLAVLPMTTVSAGDGPVRRRDLRYRSNNGGGSFSYQYTSVHSGLEGDAAKALSYQHRLEQFRNEKRAPVAVATSRVGVVPAAPPVAVAVVAVNARSPQHQHQQKPQFPTRANAVPVAADRRRTTVDISPANLQRSLGSASYSHTQVQVQQLYH